MDNYLQHRKILIVEDEIIILMMMEGMLEDMGCEAIATAHTNDSAIALIQTQFFDAAFLDMNLNGNSSSDVADMLVEYHVPFAYSTGNSIHDNRDGFCNRPVLRKPFGDEEFNRVLSALLHDGAMQPKRNAVL